MSPVQTKPTAFEVAVPSSTSNLGPGFDLCGLALSLWLRVRAQRIDRDSRELGDLRGEARAWPLAADNLLIHAFERVSLELGARGVGVRFDVDSEIPLGRGVGSSGAAVAAGALLAAAFAPRAIGREQLHAICAEIEGHPDNVTPALLGGCTLAVPRSSGPPAVVRVAVHGSLGFALAWPDRPLETKLARSILPAQVPFRDAVENSRCLALLIAGLESGDPELLHLGGEDRLHVPHRLPLIAGGAPALDAAREAGAWLATISGSGSALFAIGARERAAEIAEAMRAELAKANAAAFASAPTLVTGEPTPRPAE